VDSTGTLSLNERGYPNADRDCQTLKDSPISATTAHGSTSDDDLRLVKRIAAKDQRALEVIYYRYAPRLGHFLARFLSDPELIAETINDTMLALWRQAPGYDPERARLSTWLFSIAHNYLRRAALRRDTERQTLDAGEDGDDDLPDYSTDPERTASGWEIGDALASALQELSPEHRVVIELTFGEGLSYKEIAALTDCPENTVKTRMWHARRRLAKSLSHVELSDN
jgi:RNA polymerase sigma-70 factor (ECF subfamily)